MAENHISERLLVAMEHLGVTMFHVSMRATLVLRYQFSVCVYGKYSPDGYGPSINGEYKEDWGDAVSSLADAIEERMRQVDSLPKQESK